MRDGQGREGVLFHEQYGFALGVDFQDDVEDFLHQKRGEAERGLVEHHQIRAAHECAPHGEHLLFAAGERAALLPTAFFEPREQVVDPIDVLLDPFLVVADVRAEHQVFLNREVGEDAAALRAYRDAPSDDVLRGFAEDLFRFGPTAAPDDRGEQHFALRILHEAGDGADDAAFPRAVRADKRDYLALRDAHADALHRMDAAVVDVEILDFKHGC